MADTRFRITTPLFFILANFAFGDVTSDIIVQSNGNFTLQPNVQSPPEDILWTWNENKVVEFYQEEMVEYGQFKRRTILDLTTGALTLTRLTEADSGEYVGELQIKGNLVKYRQTVKVFDAVGKPAVTCQVNGSSVTLLCSGGDRPSTQYRWEGPAIEPQSGSQLKIEAAERSDAIYTCVLHNPVGENRTDFPVKSCFPAPDAVGKPAVTCQVNGSSVTLLCSGGDRPSSQYRWEGPAIKPQPGSQLKIEAAESSDAIYTCVLHNPAGESRTDFPVKNCFPAPGSASVIISVVIVLLLFIIVGLLLFYYKKCYKKRQNEEDMEAQSGEQTRLRERDSEAAVNERQQLLPADTENVEETPVAPQERTEQYGGWVSSVKQVAGWLNPFKTHDNRQKTALTEQHKGTDGSAGIPQEESQTESLNQGEDSEERGVDTEGGNSEHPSSGTVPSSAPESAPAAPPKTENEEEKTNPPDPAQELLSSSEEVEDILESQTGRVMEAPELYGDWWSPAKLALGWFIPVKTHDERQKTALTEQHKGTDGTAGFSQEESQTESLNQGEDSEERGVETEGGNSKHPSSGTVPFSAPESPPAPPPKTENEEETFHSPPSSPSLPHPPKSPPAPAPAPVQSQDQGGNTERVAAVAESTDETGANQRAGAQRQQEKREEQDGGSDGGGAQPSGVGGGGAENPTADPAQEIPSRSEEEGDIQTWGTDTDGGAAHKTPNGSAGISQEGQTVNVGESVNLIESALSPSKTLDEDQKTALTEQHKGTDGSAGISQEESQTELLNQGEDSEKRGVETEGGEL